MDALVRIAIEALVKKILPLLEQQLAVTLQQPVERADPELAYLINESRELLDLVSSWTTASRSPGAAGVTQAPAVSQPPADELSDDAAADLLAEMEGQPSPGKSAVAAAPEPSDQAELDADADALAMLREMETPPSSEPIQTSAPVATTDDDGIFEEINEWEANDFQSDPSMLNDFITNSDELMTSVDDAILRLEQDPSNKAIIEEIFRAAHTLKGGSGMFGFKAIERVMHHMEGLFDLIRKDRLIPTAETIDIVFQGLDLLRRLLQAVKAGRPCGVQTAPVVQALSYAAKGKALPKVPASAAKAAATPAPAPTAAQSGAAAVSPSPSPSAAEHDDDSGRKEHKSNRKNEQSTIRVDLERLDVLVNLVGELVIDRTRFASIEEDLRTNFPQIKLGSNFSETVQLFGRHMNEIQDIIMKVRMVPTSQALYSLR